MGKTIKYDAKIDGVAGNAAEASRTLTLQCDDAEIVGVVYQGETRSAYTALVITPSVSSDGGATYAPIQAFTITAGVAAGVDYSVSKTTSVADEFAAQFDVAGFTHIKLVFSATNGDGSDVLNAWATRYVEGLVI